MSLPVRARFARFAHLACLARSVGVPLPAFFVLLAYVPPLGHDAPLTSTFGEYRTRHFHGGVDFTTGGRTGAEVYAIYSGCVRRVRVSGAGYGRALHLELDDGRTAVYAHLEAFAPRIQEIAERVQQQEGLYRIDHTLEDEDLRVASGELIAYSGASGAGPPHLHFELRNGEVQLNPLTNGLDAEDTSPPRIRSIILIPLGQGSLVEGRREPLALGLRLDEAGSTYKTSRVPLIQGDVGVACAVYDLADGKPDRLAPYRMRLSVDGVPVYDAKFDSVPLASSHHVDLAYNYGYAMRGSRNVVNLFCLPGRRAGLIDGEPSWEGALKVEGGGLLGRAGLSPGPHDLQIDAWDVCGNTRAATLKVLADNAPLLSGFGPAGEKEEMLVEASDPDGDRLTLVVESSLDGGVTWRPLHRLQGRSNLSTDLEARRSSPFEILRAAVSDEWGAKSSPAFTGSGLSTSCSMAPEIELQLHGGYVEAICTVSPPPLQAPLMWLVNPQARERLQPLRVERTGVAAFRASVPLVGPLAPEAAVLVAADGKDGPVAALAPIELVVVKASEVADVQLPHGAVLATSKGAFLEDAYVRTIIRDTTSAETGSELLRMSSVFAFEPAEQFFDKPVGLYLPLQGSPGNAERVGLYRSADGRSWRWVGALLRSGSTLVGGEISGFSRFCVMEDVLPPRIGHCRPRDGERTANRRPRFDARLSDSGSGLDWDRVYFSIDGVRLITAWEAEEGRAWVRLEQELSPGAHVVELHAADRAGNETVRRSSIMVTR